MSDVYFKVDFGELEQFINKLSTANSDFKKELTVFLDAIGFEFLTYVQDQIIRNDNIETTRMLQSFNKGSSEGIWEEYGELKIDVGSNVYYADYVNTGHHLVNGKWWEGSHYFDTAVKMMDKNMVKFVEKKVNQWINDYFSQFI